jgi:hypothetical protein
MSTREHRNTSAWTRMTLSSQTASHPVIDGSDQLQRLQTNAQDHQTAYFQQLAGSPDYLGVE